MPVWSVGTDPNSTSLAGVPNSVVTKPNDTGALRSRRTGCPYCSRRRATSGRNLASLHPELAAQEHPTENGHLDLEPDQVPPRSDKRV